MVSGNDHRREGEGTCPELEQDECWIVDIENIINREHLCNRGNNAPRTDDH